LHMRLIFCLLTVNVFIQCTESNVQCLQLHAIAIITSMPGL